MRVVVIGGSGHIGTFLIPRLVRAGHEVINITRGSRAAYVESPEWNSVQQVVADREQEDEAGTFGARIVKLRPDAVIDLVCFTIESAQAIVDRLRGETGHLLHCGTLWRYGPSHKLPIAEGKGTPPLGFYGEQKELIAQMLKKETANGGLLTTSLHPGHIVGPGWEPIGPTGNYDPEVWRIISAGEPLKFPGAGVDVMHHVHADDVAQAFEKSLNNPEASGGEDFNVVAPTALNVRGFAHIAAGWFGQEPNLVNVTWDEFRASTTEDHADKSWDHLVRSHCLTIEKARALIGYEPAYEPEEAVLESLRWLIDQGLVKVERPLVV